MDNQQVREALGKPQMMRLKTIGTGITVKAVKGRRLLIRTVKPWTQMDEAMTKSKLVLPDGVKEANSPIPTYGIVVQVGDECLMGFKEEDIVLFGKFSGTDFAMQEDDFRIMHEEEVLALLDVDLATFAAVPVKER